MRFGFTLIEAIATIIILATLGSVASTILMTAMNGYTNAAIGAQMQSEASIALDRITRELRKALRDSSASNLAPLISSVSASSIAWNTTSSLTLSGTTLNFVDSGAASRPLLQDVSAFVIQCYDDSNAPLASNLSGAATQSIRRVSITITMQRNGVSESVRSRIEIRSIMSGSS
jgi:type II secretory pathway pseudopilin PulG